MRNRARTALLPVTSGSAAVKRCRLSVRAISVLAFAILTCLALSARAQVTYRVTSTPDRLLADFVAEVQSGKPGEVTAYLNLMHVLSHRQQYPAQTFTDLLAGLEQAVLQNPNALVRTRAVSIFASVGSRRRPDPVPGIAQRMLRMHQRSSDPVVRATLLADMGLSAEPQVVVRFVGSVATGDPRSADFPGAANYAISALVAMGDVGRPVLRDLHERDMVREPEARVRLGELAKRDYRPRR